MPLFIFLHRPTHVTTIKRYSRKHYLQFVSLLPCDHCMLVAQPVSWTLYSDRPRKTGSRYNDTISCFGKPKGSVTMSQKVTALFHCLLGDFWLKLHWWVFLPPPHSLPGEGLSINPAMPKEGSPSCGLLYELFFVLYMPIPPGVCLFLSIKGMFWHNKHCSTVDRSGSPLTPGPGTYRIMPIDLPGIAVDDDAIQACPNKHFYSHWDCVGICFRCQPISASGFGYCFYFRFVPDAVLRSRTMSIPM